MSKLAPRAGASIVRCTSHCKAQLFTPSTSGQRFKAVYPNLTTSLGPAHPAIFHKGDRTILTDPSSGESVELFDPRRSRWIDHFRFARYEIVGTTGVGRAIVDAFRFNAEKRIRIRQAEELFGLFPPATLAAGLRRPSD
jgi:hypothetical protein